MYLISDIRASRVQECSNLLRAFIPWRFCCRKILVLAGVCFVIVVVVGVVVGVGRPLILLVGFSALEEVDQHCPPLFPSPNALISEGLVPVFISAVSPTSDSLIGPERPRFFLLLFLLRQDKSPRDGMNELVFPFTNHQAGLPRVSVLDLFGSVLTCQAYRATAKFPKHAVETLVACSLMQFGEERLG